MTIFCTKCGTSNQPGAVFCDNCGAPLRAVPADMFATDTAPKISGSANGARSVNPAGPVSHKKIVYGTAGLAAALVIAGGVAYFAMRSPAPTADRLLAAAKAEYGQKSNNSLRKVVLCFNNIDYSMNLINVSETHAERKLWMNTLVLAGLYSPAISINSGGLYTNTMLQYTATEKLTQYREGARLCIAKTLETVDVINIEKPVWQFEDQLSKTKSLVVYAQVVKKASDVAPWMQQPEVREKVLAKISGWTYKDQSLQIESYVPFGLVGGKWATGSDLLTDGPPEQVTLAQRIDEFTNDITARAKNATRVSEIFSGITSSLFSGFGGKSNPLHGRWRSDFDGIELEFSASSCVSADESAGERCSYNIDGTTISFQSNFQSNIFPEGRGSVKMYNEDWMGLNIARQPGRLFRRMH